MTLRMHTVVLLAVLAGCTAVHDDFDHDHQTHHEDEGPEALEITVWADHTELFMEYEPLVAAQPSRFAAHLTTLRDFKAVTSGVLTLSLEPDQGPAQVARAQAPADPGIFRFTITPEQAGPCRLSLAFEGQGITDTIGAGAATVHATTEAAAAVAHEDHDGVAYTKEQQWKTDFATAEVGERPLQPSVRASGEIRPVSGHEARLTAPARGRVALATPAPLLGMSVEKGQLLASVSPYLAAGGDRSSLEAEVRSAEAEHAAALSQVARLERLLEEAAVPERRVEEARARVSVARAKLDGALGRRAQYNQGVAGMVGRGSGAFQLRSPINGTLVEMDATSGDSVPEGKLLFVVIDVSHFWVVANVFEPDIPRAESAASAWFTIEGYEQPFVINATNGRLITVGRVIDPASRTVPVVFEMENPEGKIRIGQFAEVYIATGEAREMLAVPIAALLEDGGKQVVFVQTEGETFERRVVRTGVRAKGWVSVLAGVIAGERVVTEGAYEVRLAAASGSIPETGHVH